MKQLLTIAVILMTFSVAAQNKYCKKIKVTHNEFTGETTKRSPVLMPVAFTQVDSMMFLSLSTEGSTPATGEGVILLFQDGSKLEWNVRTDVRVARGYKRSYYSHSAFILLNNDEIEQLKTKLIKGFMLYIHQQEVGKPEQYHGYLNCMN